MFDITGFHGQTCSSNVFPSRISGYKIQRFEWQIIHLQREKCHSAIRNRRTINGRSMHNTQNQANEVIVQTIYQKQFGADFELINDSSRLDKNKLDPNKAYLSIQFCEPFLTDEEILQRPTYFDRMTDIRKFVYEIP